MSEFQITYHRSDEQFYTSCISFTTKIGDLTHLIQAKDAAQSCRTDNVQFFGFLVVFIEDVPNRLYTDVKYIV